MPFPQPTTDEDATIRSAVLTARLEALGRVRRRQSRQAATRRISSVPTTTEISACES